MSVVTWGLNDYEHYNYKKHYTLKKNIYLVFKLLV